MDTSLFKNLQASIAAKVLLSADKGFLEKYNRVLNKMLYAYKHGNRLYVAGNGGSASDASHFVAELVGKLSKPRRPFPAVSLMDPPTITAIANDFGYEKVFSRQLEANLVPGDVFLAISTSGKSPNILRALEYCMRSRYYGILLTGLDGGPGKDIADHTLIVPGDETSTIQECHELVLHSLAEDLEKELLK